MTDKEKQIEEMARIIHFDYWGACDADSCSDCPHSDFNICNDEIIAEKLYNKLCKETVTHILKELKEEIDEGYIPATIKIKELAKRYCVEVEE